MPGSFAYTVATNKVVVTAGTSGSPADFPSFVTADQAGTGTFLKTASAPSKTYTLTYPVRPVEFRAIVTKFIIASKTTETDYLFITGTDAWDVAQTESIDVSAGNGTYTSTKRWRTQSNISCSDAADGTGTLWADGTLAVTQDIWGVIWNYGNNQYRLDCNTTWGDGSTSTYFTSKKEMVVWTTATSLSLTANATVCLGELAGSYGRNGSQWYITPPDASQMVLWDGTNRTFLMYNSLLYNLANNQIAIANGGTFTAINSTLAATEDLASSWRKRFNFMSGVTLSMTECYIVNVYCHISSVTPTVFSDVHIHSCWGGYEAYAACSVTGLSVTSRGAGYDIINSIAGTVNVINPKFTISSVANAVAGGIIKEQYTCNVHIGDKDGMNLAGATVDCEDQFGTAVWAAGTVTTDANGDIAAQTITYRQWVGTAETLTTYSPHKFTFSKAGYQTLITENITVSAAIRWNKELQPVRPTIATNPNLLPLGVKQAGVIA